MKRIMVIVYLTNPEDACVRPDDRILFVLDDGSSVTVDGLWLRDHRPEVGGYFTRDAAGATGYAVRAA